MAAQFFFKPAHNLRLRPLRGLRLRLWAGFYTTPGDTAHAKSTSAERFLREFVEKAPFPILSIQVDGGSEFMAEFENACAELNIPLIVLPPSRPKYNGGVERGNRTFKDEFYYQPRFNADSIGAIRNELAKAVDKYNAYRPHYALKGKTPLQYLRECAAQGSTPSQTP